MYVVNNFAGEGQGKIHHVVVAKEKSNTISRKQNSDKWEGYNKWGGWQGD